MSNVTPYNNVKYILTFTTGPKVDSRSVDQRNHALLPKMTQKVCWNRPLARQSKEKLSWVAKKYITHILLGSHIIYYTYCIRMNL